MSDCDLLSDGRDGGRRDWWADDGGGNVSTWLGDVVGGGFARLGNNGGLGGAWEVNNRGNGLAWESDSASRVMHFGSSDWVWVLDSLSLNMADGLDGSDWVWVWLLGSFGNLDRLLDCLLDSLLDSLLDGLVNGLGDGGWVWLVDRLSDGDWIWLLGRLGDGGWIWLVDSLGNGDGVLGWRLWSVSWLLPLGAGRGLGLSGNGLGASRGYGGLAWWSGHSFTLGAGRGGNDGCCALVLIIISAFLNWWEYIALPWLGHRDGSSDPSVLSGDSFRDCNGLGRTGWGDGGRAGDNIEAGRGVGDTILWWVVVTTGSECGGSKRESGYQS